MICPKCRYQRSFVVDSRPHGDVVRRRRQCYYCQARFTTIEIKKEEYDKLKEQRGAE